MDRLGMLHPLVYFEKCEILILHMDVSENSGTPKSSILKGCSIINHAFWGTTILGNTYIMSIIQQVDGMITFLLNILSIADQNHGWELYFFETIVNHQLLVV